jgi:sulfatase modifying factor 1
MRSKLLIALLISGLTNVAPADDRAGQLKAKKDVPLPMSAPFDAAKAKTAQEAWARHLGRPSPVETNSVGIDLVLIPPGKFQMGSPPSEKDGSGTEDQVEVTLTTPFLMGKTEVTQSQWKQVMETSPWLGNEDVREGDDVAASYVSWEAAKAFCKKLSEKENAVYRLPTEAEWEYACRAGTTTRFSFGEDDSRLGEFAWYDKNADGAGEKFAHEVARKKANPFGLFDMHGNVWESCEDTYTDRIPGGPNPLVSVKVKGARRVLRGGGWFSDPALCRSADRSRDSPTSHSSFVGFRVVRRFDQ